MENKPGGLDAGLRVIVQGIQLANTGRQQFRAPSAMRESETFQYELGRVAPFAPDCLAVARIEGGEKILETGVTLIVPVKLLVVTLQESAFGEKFPLRLAGKGDVDR